MSLLRLSFLGVKGFKMSVFCYKSQNSTFQPSKVARIQPIDDVPFVFYEKNLMNNMSSVQFNKKKREVKLIFLTSLFWAKNAPPRSRRWVLYI
jgi:hypothetical protein